MNDLPHPAIEAMVKARKPPVCQACKGTGFMEDGPPGATYSAPCTFCRDGVPNWAFVEANAMLAAAFKTGLVITTSELANLYEAAETVYQISERDTEPWRHLRRSLDRARGLLGVAAGPRAWLRRNA